MAESLQRFKAELFKALAHPARIRILELLRDGEKRVSQLQLELAVEGSGVSQQLAILRMKNLVDTRRVGNLIYYRLRDPQVNDLLDAARRIFEAHVIQLQSMTEDQPPWPRGHTRARPRPSRPRFGPKGG
jgi:DNA-binding transcriptional ArsR family regulator